MAKLTNGDFAGVACSIARDASSWAASLCLTHGRIHLPANDASVARFAAEIRDRLALLEEWVSEEPALAEQEKGDA